MKILVVRILNIFFTILNINILNGALGSESDSLNNKYLPALLTESETFQ